MQDDFKRIRQQEASRAAVRVREGAAASRSAASVTRAAGGSYSHAQPVENASLGMLAVALALLMGVQPRA